MYAATLDDKYERQSGRVFLSGTQALVRLPLMQRARDAAAGLNTAGYISGYRGSPLGGYDLQLTAAQARLNAAQILFQPGVNEDLAATAIWGTQQVPSLPGAKVDGVFAIWYGKGPGVDRSGDPIKHANRMGTSAHGGVLVAFGDDHPGKSSTIAHQSEQALAANGVPVLYPAGVQEYLDLGLHGFALSRAAGVWVGFKCVNETVEATATVEVDAARVTIVAPHGVPLPPSGVHARLAFDPMGDEVRLARFKLPLAQAYVRSNGLDRVTHGADAAPGGLGIVAPGKSWLDVVAALAALGLDAQRLRTLGVSVYKPALIWPLEPEGLTAFARGRSELLVVEEKAAFIEPQAAHCLFNLPSGERPRLSGKRDPDGAALLCADVAFEPLAIARVIGMRLRALGRADAALEHRLAELDGRLAAAETRRARGSGRTAYFCSGCPHNTSTKVPEGSLALAGIGCHTMALYMNRSTLPPTQMGGEGMTWAGIAPFTEQRHAFQNLGDGTYFHSGLLAVRATVAAGVDLTYKILYNDAVAMTGGQAVEGHLSVAEITYQLRAERVQRIAVVSDDVGKYGPAPGFAAGVSVHDRRELDAVQRELREVPGVSAIIYDQVCAAEKRRRRKRGRMPEPTRRVLINPLVCEGCGDCSAEANCVSIQPLETEFGRKRAIDQSGCNKDYSCLNGFCPSFVTVDGARLRRPKVRDLDAALLAALPPPPVAAPSAGINLLVTGIGGTGVVTVGAVLGMAAHLEGKHASIYDMTGLAQKGGAVLSHVKIAADTQAIVAPRVGLGEADLVLGCDLVVAASADALRSIDPGRTRVALNTHLVPTAAFQLRPDVDFQVPELIADLEATAGAARVSRVDATGTALALLGDTLGTNLFMVGFALQQGWLPLALASIERAIELNGAAVDFNRRALALGRLAAAEPARVAQLRADAAGAAPAVRGTAVDTRSAFLTEYQDAAYAARYRRFVERAAAAEMHVVPGATQLADAVARYYFKLLAYKDEYEVARLYSGAEFARQLDATFEGSYRLKFHLAPPALWRASRARAAPQKREYGGWMLAVFGALARFKFLRGTPFDPFGRSAERRTERELIREYESLVEGLLAGLTPERHALAVEIASIPEQIRGFGHIKERHLRAARVRQSELLARWQAPPPAGALDNAA
jgi:indolepyruvate ferredoxin oxidoreductase